MEHLDLKKTYDNAWPNVVDKSVNPIPDSLRHMAVGWLVVYYCMF
jgi:hypothetical protein